MSRPWVSLAHVISCSRLCLFSRRALYNDDDDHRNCHCCCYCHCSCLWLHQRDVARRDMRDAVYRSWRQQATSEQEKTEREPKNTKNTSVPHRTGARRTLASSEHITSPFPPSWSRTQLARQRYATWLGIAAHMWGLRGALHIPAAMLRSAQQQRTPAPPRSYKVPVHWTDLASDCGAHSKSVGIAVPARLLLSLSALPSLLRRGAFLNSGCGRSRVPSACR